MEIKDSLRILEKNEDFISYFETQNNIKKFSENNENKT
jgi:hypothetical protein